MLKPAEQSPASCHRLGLLAGQAGLPPGTLNVVQGFGPGEAGQALTEDPGVDLVTFTGESATGRAILAAGAPTLKRVSFELGGKGANLVFADADLANAVDWSLRAIFLNAGQVCLSGSRLYVQRPVYDEFLDRFVAGAEAMRLGDPLDEATEVGPLASDEHWAQGHRLPRAGRRRGRQGPHRRPRPTAGGSGRPCWSTSTRTCASAARRSSARWSWSSRSTPTRRRWPWPTTRPTASTRWCSPRACAAPTGSRPPSGPGTIWVNCFFVRDLRAPFGGYKDSGIGREGGGYSREFFTEAKAVVMQL